MSSNLFKNVAISITDTHTYIRIHVHEHTIVTGIWKADQNFTIGILHFIAPANGYTHTYTTQYLFMVALPGVTN